MMEILALWTLDVEPDGPNDAGGQDANRRYQALLLDGCRRIPPIPEVLHVLLNLKRLVGIDAKRQKRLSNRFFGALPRDLSDFFFSHRNRRPALRSGLEPAGPFPACPAMRNIRWDAR